MDVKKLALILAGLVIIGLLIFATISNIIPAAFNFFECAFQTFLDPAQEADGIAGCLDKIEFEFNGNDAEG